MLFLGQVYAPTETDDRSLYIFVCNTRRCSLTSAGWVVLRNQTLMADEDTQDTDSSKQAADATTTAKGKPGSSKETVWKFLDEDPADDAIKVATVAATAADEGEEVSEDLSDLMEMLSARDASYKASNTKSLTAPAAASLVTAKQTASSTAATSKDWSIQLARVCYPLNDLDDPYMEIDKVTPDDDDDDEADEDEDSDDDKEDEAHIAQLLSEYMSSEEDTSVVEMLKNIETHNRTVSSAKGKAAITDRAKPGKAHAEMDEDDREDDKFDKQLARADPKSKAELLFQKIVSYAPRQVLRYAYCGKPLWCTSPAPDLTAIPACELCGQPRIFELQLMPALLSLWKSEIKTSGAQLENSKSWTAAAQQQQPTSSQLSAFLSTLDDGFDYGVVAIYCCPDGCCPRSDEISCKIPLGCHIDEESVTWRECVVVQTPSDIG
jgi:hypothetical protein